MWSCCCFSAFSRASLFQGSGDRLSLDASSSLLMVMYCKSRRSMVRGCCCGSSSLITVSIPEGNTGESGDSIKRQMFDFVSQAVKEFLLPAGVEALAGGGTADRGRLDSFSGLDEGGCG